MPDHVRPRSRFSMAAGDHCLPDHILINTLYSSLRFVTACVSGVVFGDRASSTASAEAFTAPLVNSGEASSASSFINIGTARHIGAYPKLIDLNIYRLLLIYRKNTDENTPENT